MIIVRMRWDKTAWSRRFGRRSIYDPHDQFARHDETFLRQEEFVGPYRIVLTQINQYRLRKKLFRVEAWSIDPILDDAISIVEEDAQTAAEHRFDSTVTEYAVLLDEKERED